MTNLFGAISDDHKDYRTYCKYKGVTPLEIDDSKNFYETKEWKEIKEIPHMRGCIGMALEDKLKKEIDAIQ